MSKKQIRLVSLGVASYARINKTYKADVNYPVDVTEELKKVDADNGIVLVFPKNYRFQQSEGNQGVGKTSLLNSLLEVTANILAPNAINSIDQDKRISLRTYGLDGFLYSIRSTKSTYVIERIETDENGDPVLNEKQKEIKATISEPKSMIKKIVGPAGISPQWLKDMKPAEQVNWLRSLYTLDTEVLQQEIQIKKDYETAYKARTSAGNDHKRYKAQVDASAYYADYNTWETYFASTNFDDVEQKFKTAQTDFTDYSRYEIGLKQLVDITKENAERDVLRADTNIVDLNEQIRVLQEKLSRAHDEKQSKVEAVNTINQRIADGRKWMEDNSKIKETYETINEQIKEASEFKSKKQAWETMLSNKKQMDHYSSEYVRLGHVITGYADAKKKLIELFSPEIEAFEVCIPDEDDKREGLYYHGKTLDQLSESELWEMATQLWSVLNVQMVFVENINTLGTGAVAMFNKFIEQGGYVFATMMNREEKNLKITFNNQIA